MSANPTSLTCATCGGSRADTIAKAAERPSYNKGASRTRCWTCYLAYAQRRYALRRQAAGHEYASHVERRKKPKRLATKQPWSRVAYRNCVECGALFVIHGQRQSITTCASCPSYAERNLFPSQQRRMRVVAAGDRGIHWRTLGVRDAWTCHLCGRKVKQSAGVDGVPRGATVDHLIPISDGGSHVWANVALAHRDCNMKRGNKGMAQLLLVG